MNVLDKRLLHIGFAFLTSSGVLFAAYDPAPWSGVAGYVVAATTLIAWSVFVGILCQRQKKRSG